MCAELVVKTKIQGEDMFLTMGEVQELLKVLESGIKVKIRGKNVSLNVDEAKELLEALRKEATKLKDTAFVPPSLRGAIKLSGRAYLTPQYAIYSLSEKGKKSSRVPSDKTLIIANIIRRSPDREAALAKIMKQFHVAHATTRKYYIYTKMAMPYLPVKKKTQKIITVRKPPEPEEPHIPIPEELKRIIEKKRMERI